MMEWEEKMQKQNKKKTGISEQVCAACASDIS